ncbi:MAG: DUF4114 domain-containing protein [Oculatellaceae cyanobacterium Prado106]|jgi:hypothetical protein|nr:DUF4114 domain-containing protein [Oculatellaceae cyanobacterium Prado106]
MKTALLTGLLTAATTVTALVATMAPASAFSWNNSWTQPTVYSKTQTKFDDAPFQKFVQKERVEIQGAQQFMLDPSKLMMKYAHDVSVFFINEGAGFRNQLAYEATSAKGAKTTGLIFNDISSTESIISNSDGPLKKGDGVNLGKMAAGTQLDFWLRADGKNKGSKSNIFGTQVASNGDKLQHVVAYAYKNYILLGFEDLWGEKDATGGNNQKSDRDFNDAVFVLDIGAANVRNLVQPVPEPTVTLGLMGAGAAALFGTRRRRQTASAEQQ